jgi:hypothetical protein
VASCRAGRDGPLLRFLRGAVGAKRVDVSRPCESVSAMTPFAPPNAGACPTLLPPRVTEVRGRTVHDGR